MNIPATCNAWADMMRSDPDTAQVLDNMESDSCVDAAHEYTFFQRIEASGPPTDVVKAWNAAKNAASGASGGNDLYCTGKEVPDDRFLSLVRVIRAEDAFYVVDDAYRSGKETGTTHAELEKCDFDTLHDFVVGYDGSTGGNIGKPNTPAWVAEHSAGLASLFSNGVELTKRLGLPWQHQSVVKRNMYVRIAFDRGDLPESLHVPRVLDATDNPPFRPNPDCAADHGLTMPLPGAAGPGFPEAVHRACKVERIELTCEKA